MTSIFQSPVIKRGHTGILYRAVAYWLAKDYSGSGQWLDSKGTHHAQLGSTSGLDSNDPLFVVWDGTTYMYLPGIAGNYASAPDSNALDITGDIDIRCEAALTDWTPAINSTFVGKWAGAANQRSYLLRVDVDGKLVLFLSSNGTDFPGAISSVATGVVDGAMKWVRATWRQSDGRAQFFLSGDGSAWTQLGTNRTISIASIFASTTALEIGSDGVGTVNLLGGKVRRAQVRSNILDDGTGIVFDADCTDESKYNASLSTLTEKSANAATVTLNRSATGRKLAVVDRDLFLLGTDDYFQIADHADLDFGAADPFTAAVCYRVYGTTTNQVLMAKKNNLTTSEGYFLGRGSTANVGKFGIGDGTNATEDVMASAVSEGVLSVMAGVRRVSADNIEAYKDGTGSGSPTTDATTGTMANALVLRIGATAGATPANFLDGEIVGLAIFRIALTDAQIAELVTEMKARA